MKKATISSGQTASAAIDMRGFCATGLVIPSSFSGTSVSFTASEAVDGTFSPVKNNGVLVSFTVAAGDVLKFPIPSLFAGIPYMKIVSGTSEAADRAITVLDMAL